MREEENNSEQLTWNEGEQVDFVYEEEKIPKTDDTLPPDDDKKPRKKGFIIGVCVGGAAVAALLAAFFIHGNNAKDTLETTSETTSESIAETMSAVTVTEYNMTRGQLINSCIDAWKDFAYGLSGTDMAKEDFLESYVHVNMDTELTLTDVEYGNYYIVDLNSDGLYPEMLVAENENSECTIKCYYYENGKINEHPLQESFGFEEDADVFLDWDGHNNFLCLAVEDTAYFYRLADGRAFGADTLFALDELGETTGQLQIYENEDGTRSLIHDGVIKTERDEGDCELGGEIIRTDTYTFQSAAYATYSFFDESYGRGVDFFYEIKPLKFTVNSAFPAFFATSAVMHDSVTLLSYDQVSQDASEENADTFERQVYPKEITLTAVGAWTDMIYLAVTDDGETIVIMLKYDETTGNLVFCDGQDASGTFTYQDSSEVAQ